MNFLLVEDNRIAAHAIKINLEHLGVVVDIAGCGREALRMFRKGEYDAVLLDACLPDISGVEVARTMRKNSDIAIFGISSMGDVIRDECLQAGFTEVFKKPTDLKRLFTILNLTRDKNEKTINVTRSGPVSGGMPTTNYAQTGAGSLSKRRLV